MERQRIEEDARLLKPGSRHVGCRRVISCSALGLGLLVVLLINAEGSQRGQDQPFHCSRVPGTSVSATDGQISPRVV
jgi:hypothetical protein